MRGPGKGTLAALESVRADTSALGVPVSPLLPSSWEARKSTDSASVSDSSSSLAWASPALDAALSREGPLLLAAGLARPRFAGLWVTSSLSVFSLTSPLCLQAAPNGWPAKGLTELHACLLAVLHSPELPRTVLKLHYEDKHTEVSTSWSLQVLCCAPVTCTRL